MDQLEARAFGPDDRDDPRWIVGEMAQWLDGLSERDQARVREGLKSWVHERSHPWHASTALHLAVSRNWDDVLGAALDRASSRVVRDDIEAWFEHDLITAIEDLPTSAGKEYLATLVAQVGDAATLEERSVCLRALLGLCATRSDDRGECLQRARYWLDRWGDDRLRRRWTPLVERLEAGMA